jgi:hypothetical protein
MEVYSLFRTLLPESQRANWDLLIAYVNHSAALSCRQTEITAKLHWAGVVEFLQIKKLCWSCAMGLGLSLKLISYENPYSPAWRWKLVGDETGYSSAFLHSLINWVSKMTLSSNTLEFKLFIWKKKHGPVMSFYKQKQQQKTPCPQSASELYRPSYHRLSAKLVHNFLRIEGATWSAWRIPTAVFSDERISRCCKIIDGWATVRFSRKVLQKIAIEYVVTLLSTSVKTSDCWPRRHTEVCGDFVSHSRQTEAQCLKLGHDCFLQHPFYITVYSKS